MIMGQRKIKRPLSLMQLCVFRRFEEAKMKDYIGNQEQLEAQGANEEGNF